MYERQEGTGLEIGSYAHRPITLDADEIPSIEESALSPTELPFTQEDFDPQMEQALELMPEIVGDETVGREVRDQRRAVGHLRRPAAARRDARGQGLVVGGGDLDQGGARRRQDRGGADRPRRVRDRRLRVEHRARLLRARSTRTHIVARAGEGFNKMYGIVHPGEQWASDRGVRLSPFYERAEAAGGRLLRGRRLGAPAVVRVQRRAAGGVRRPDQPPRGRVGRALVVADHQRRAPGHARPGGDDRPERVRHLRRDRARAPWKPSSGSPCGR